MFAGLGKKRVSQRMQAGVRVRRAAILKLVRVKGTAWTLEDLYQPAAQRVFAVTNCRMVSGRIITRVPTLT
jgi:hypothetical protein